MSWCHINYHDDTGWSSSFSLLVVSSVTAWSISLSQTLTSSGLGLICLRDGWSKAVFNELKDGVVWLSVDLVTGDRHSYLV